jgi:hypothetical protein
VLSRDPHRTPDILHKVAGLEKRVRELELTKNSFTIDCGVAVPHPGATYYAHLSFQFKFRGPELTAGAGGTTNGAWGLPQMGEGSLTSALGGSAASAQFGNEWPYLIGAGGVANQFNSSWSGAFETGPGSSAICVGFNAFRAWDAGWHEISVGFDYTPADYTDTPDGSAILTVFEAGTA